jgi:hypothetical protein
MPCQQKIPMVFSLTDYLLAALVLIVLAIWFERWWRK